MNLLDDYDEIEENERTELSLVISGYKEVPNGILRATSPSKALQMKP